MFHYQYLATVYHYISIHVLLEHVKKPDDKVREGRV